MSRALEVRCPTCGALPGAPCISTFGLRVPKAKPHPPRVRASQGVRLPSRSKPIPTWARREVRVRSRDRCEVTGLDHVCTRRATEHHHVQRRSQGGSNDPSNLLHCCKNGHDAIHAHPAEALRLGYLASWKAAV